MALGITDNQNYTDIAKAIRGKTGGAVTYKPGEMAAAITALPTTEYPTYTGATEFTPSDSAQVVETKGQVLASNITVNPIPSNYGKITYTGFVLRVE